MFETKGAILIEFVKWGIGKDTIWREVKGQSILGEDDFVEGLLPHIKKGRDIPDIPKSHRYVNRAELKTIFKENVLRNKENRRCYMHSSQGKFFSLTALQMGDPIYCPYLENSREKQ